MKKLYLARHADAQVTAGEDIDRKLSKEGHEQAAALTDAMVNKNFSCDIVLCSTAFRARQTCDRILPSVIGEPPVEHLENLYYVELDTVIQCLKDLEDTYKSALVVSHNPVMSDFATYLVGKEIHFETGTLKFLELDIKSWRKITPKCAKLIWSIPS